MRLSYAIVFVSDMQRSVKFYRDALGLPLKFESPAWTEFATAGATLALHIADGSGPVTDPSQPTSAGRCRPGFGVPNLEAFHRTVVGKGVVCVQEPKDTFGAKLAQYLDPDGLVITVSEVA